LRRTTSRCRHVFDVSVARLRPDLLETTAAPIAVTIGA
jgi:hypothetical protein